MTDELVLVIPRAELFADGGPSFQGFSPTAEAYLRRIMAGYLFMPRRRAENDPRYKQVIPYVALQMAGGQGEPHRYMIFQRVRGGDPRLGRLYSVGLGGHINSGDVITTVTAETAPVRARTEKPRRTPARQGRLVRQIQLAPSLRAGADLQVGPALHDHPLLRGIRRELREEVALPPGAQLSLLGAINDDANSVGSVHFGLAFLLRVQPQARIRLRREAGSVQVGDVLTLDQIRGYRHAMETWSTLLLDAGVLP